MNDRKYLDIGEWQRRGGLQEANRLFFHPHGWALEIVRVEEDGWLHDSRRVRDLADSLIARGRIDIDDAEQELAAALLAAEGILNDLYPPGSVFLSGIWDATDDPEGIVFGKWGEEDVAKARAVRAERDRHAQARYRMFFGDGVAEVADLGQEDDDIEPFTYEWKEPEE